ncbi:protein RRP5 homolog [Stylophora pistillata]|uniref:protein RRP5 homolog n=1 Tax=Stylophora pistillata TaxID=50429 RepID=UPI000C04E174|nr:protein RRP5 homolog [Stylophora pistillata]
MATKVGRGKSALKSPETPSSVFNKRNAEEVDFPRGGTSALSPLEVRKIKNEAERDVLFGRSSSDPELLPKSGKKSKKPKKSKVDDSKPEFIAKSKQKFVETLTFKKVYVGMKVLGAIREVNEYDMVMSLPNGLSGFVHITNVNEKITERLKNILEVDESGDTEDTPSFPGLTKFFAVGSLVQCSVLETEGSKPGQRKIKLSVDPKELNSGITKSSLKQGMVLSGFVKSVEDHGYLISFGIDGTSAFLPKTSLTREFEEGNPLSLLIKSVAQEQRFISVSVHEDEIQGAMITEDLKLKFSALLPGMLVKASVTQVTGSGLILNFLGGFEGSADIIHLPNCGGDGKNLEETYPVKKKVKCRILYVNANKKTVGVSLQEKVVLHRTASFGHCSMGDVIDDAVVIRVDQKMGLFFSFSDGILGFTHISRVSDEHVEKLGKKYKVGSTHRCRILGFNSLDGLVNLTMERSVIEQPFLSYCDIKPGELVKGKIMSLEKFGMFISLTDHIRGLCRTLHLADINLQHPEKKLKDGKTVKCRVLSVWPDSRRLFLTHKKTLIESSLPIITEYTQAQPGVSCHGFVVAIKDFGCIVSFYNNIKGLVPRSELGISADTDPRSAFYLGQVLLCHVLSCEPDQMRLRLSLKKSSRPGPALENVNITKSLLEADVVNSSEEGLDVALLPSGAPAFLPVSHLSDHVSNCKALLSVYKPSTRLTNVVYYGINKRQEINVSLKPSLVKAASEDRLLTSFKDVEVGMVLPGFVKKVMSYGVFVEFSRGIFGLAPNSFLADQFVSEPAFYFPTGQTVMAKVTEIDEERQRFLVSLKMSDCCPEKTIEGSSDPGAELLENYLSERQKIVQQLASSSEEMEALFSLGPGSCVEGKVLTVKFRGILLQLANGVQGFTPHQLAKGVSCEPGEVVCGCVLDWDFDKKCVIVSLNPQLVAKRKAVETQNKTQKKLKHGRIFYACVQLIRENYMVVTIPQHNYQLAYAPTKMHLNDIRDASKRFAVGQEYSSLVQRPVKANNDLLPLVMLQEKQIGKENVVPGAITTAQVKSVKDLQLNVNLCDGKFHGRVHVTQIWDKVIQGESPLKGFHNGDKIQVKILGFRDLKTHKYLPITHTNFTKAVAELTLKPSELSEVSSDRQSASSENNEGGGADKKLEDYQVGEDVNCFVKSATDYCVWMMLSPSVNGRVGLLHASSDVEVLKSLKTHFKPGDGYRCVVLSVDQEKKCLDLSLSAESKIEATQVLTGQVTKIFPDQGLLVRLPMSKYGVVGLTDLKDNYDENPLESFKTMQLVRCFVLSTKGKDQFDLSLRPSRTQAVATKNEGVTSVNEEDREIKSISDLKEGDIIRGFVKSCSDVGVFVSLAHHIVGRVQIKNLSQYYVKNWKPLFPKGKLVKGKVLSVDPIKGHLELSLKGTDVGGPDPAPKPKRLDEKEKRDKEKKERKRKRKKEKESKTKDGSDDEAEFVLKKLKEDSDHEDSPESESEEEGETSGNTSDEEADDASSHKPNGAPRLEISSGFDWNEDGNYGGRTQKRQHENNDNDDDDESSESETEASGQVARKKSKRQKRAAKKAEEEFLYKTEQSLLDQDRLPETAEDFDRAVLSSPNNSVVWLQYMAYHLHTTDIDKARTVAERALKTISFREEQEKLNVWVALMNLENLYGTQESLVRVFERALQQNEPKKVFFQLTGIYSRTDKTELAEQLYHTMAKRFSQSKKVWVGFSLFYMKQGKLDLGRKLLQRSLKSLPKRKHIETIVQFALHEFKYGEPQRGQTMFESILTNYPKRSDLWSVYLDMMIKQGDVEPVRQIFERVIHINMSSKKMKLFFKRYLDFERKYGDAFSIENVKTQAMAYVESKAALS